MGFYGNITNTSNTTFSFDRIYPNRLAMDANANNDGIFVGRYVLVEYDQDATYPNVFKKGDEFYSSPNAEFITKVRYLNDTERYYYQLTADEYPIKGKQYYIKIEDSYIPADIKSVIKFEDSNIEYYEKVENFDGVYEEEIVQVQEIQTDEKGHTTYINIGFYECNGSIEIDGVKYATFVEVIKDPQAKSNYIQNFAIDERHQDAEQQKSFKGYDSTVWMKSSITTNEGKLITKYVNIADLNSVVPTFDIAADAPTMEPITPHFDADSTNVYYKLHVQTPFGFRVKEESDENRSDVKTTHYTTTYNKQDNTMNTGIGQSINASIYYNQKGFDPNEKNSHVKDDNEQELPNYIKIEPTGKSSNYNNYSHQVSNYYKEIGKIKKEDWKQNTYYYLSNNKFKLSTAWSNTTYYVKEEVGDIQEFSLHLPAIGNMMSDAWDIIHGPLRNDDMRQYLTNEEGKMLDKDGNITEDESKAVKVDSLQGRLNSIAALEKHQIPIKQTDGALVGTTINGNTNSIITDNFDAPIIEDDFETDDAWIKTQVNADRTPNAISIHHTFNKTPNSFSVWDKNGDDEWNTWTAEDIPEYKENIINNMVNKGTEQDDLRFYVPYVDQTGHVVGHNIERVRLPFGYKTFTTKGLALDENDKEIVSDLYTTISNVENGNNTSSASAGNSQTIANNTQDSMAIEPFNKWIQTQLSNDKLVIAHEIHAINTEKSSTDLNDLKDNEIQNEINIPDWDYDEAGHIKKKGEHTYTLPYGYKQFTTNGRVTSTNDLYTTITQVTNGNDTETKAIVQNNQKSCVANNTQDTLNVAAGNKWIQTAIVNNEDQADSLTIAHEIHAIKDSDATGTNLNGGNVTNIASDNIIIPDLVFDKAGHLTENHSHTYTLPYGYKTIKIGKQAESTAVSNLTGHDSDTSVIADNTQDTLTILPANKWVCLHGTNDDNTNNIGDVIRVGHQVNAIATTAKNAVNLNTASTYDSMTNGNTIKIPDWTYDAAGHITAKQSRTYTLPYGYKQIVATNSTAVNVEPSTVTANPTADNTQDTLNIKAANKWIKLNTTDNSTDGNSISFAHTLVGTNFGNTYYSNVDTSNTDDDHNRNLDFGSTFKIFNLTTDNAGHTTKIDTNNITLPTIAFTNGTNGNMVTGISYSYSSTDHKGTFTETRANVGTLALTGYGGTATGNVSSTDSINTAFAKVENKINTFLKDASITTGAIDTLKELQDYISTHTTEAANMVAATNAIYAKNASTGVESGVLIDKTEALAERIDNINGEVSAIAGNYISSIKIENDTLSIGTTAFPTLSSGTANGTIKLGTGSNVAVTGLKSAAYTDVSEYIRPNVEFIYDKIQQDNGEGVITEVKLKTTIEDMAKEIASLKQILKNNGLITE